jgi:cyclopropane fatty-acyl-phospholipid synthase-like methyltransferase
LISQSLSLRKLILYEPNDCLTLYDIGKEYRVKLSYTEVFRYSDMLNPVSPTTLLLAGKLAQLGPGKIVLDLGSGKGYPSLLWASVFGARVEGFEVNRSFLRYANSRAIMLNLSSRVKYTCRDVKKLRLSKKYDVVASLGLGVARVYGSYGDALKVFKSMLYKDGILVLAEPVWLKKPVSSKVLSALGESENNLVTQPEMQELLREHGFRKLGDFVSLKEDWEIYVRPTYLALKEIIERVSRLEGEARKVLDGHKTQYDIVGKHWNMVLWVARSQ